MIYFIYGSIEKEIDLQKNINSIIKKNPNIKVQYFDANNGEEQDFMNSVSFNSIFGGKQLLILKRAETIKQGLKFFTELKKFNLSNKEIIIDYLVNDKKAIDNKIVKLFDNDKVIEIENDKKNTRVKKYIMENINCTEKEAEKIYEMKNYDIYSLISEMEKLSLYFYDIEFNMEEAMKIISISFEYQVYDYVENLIFGKKNSKIEIIEYLKEKKTWMLFIYSVANALRVYIKLKLYEKNYGIRYTMNYNDFQRNIHPKIKDYFKEIYHPYALFKKQENVNFLKIENLINNLNYTLVAEANLKSGITSDRESIEILINKWEA
ncbi:MAG: hypothetical protein GX287_05845 [Fusobacteria bacterium]|nr:hypothetical protein [Fusobacteriota bacterium]